MKASEYRNLTASQAGLKVLELAANKRTNKRARKLVEAGTHGWAWDPQVDGVVGLLRRGTNRADIVVYLDDDDFETSDDFEDLR